MAAYYSALLCSTLDTLSVAVHQDNIAIHPACSLATFLLFNVATNVFISIYTQKWMREKPISFKLNSAVCWIFWLVLTKKGGIRWLLSNGLLCHFCDLKQWILNSYMIHKLFLFKQAGFCKMPLSKQGSPLCFGWRETISICSPDTFSKGITIFPFKSWYFCPVII